MFPRLLSASVFDGVGSAVALLPVLHWLGIPLLVAKPTGLLVNTLSMTGASVHNIRAGKLDFRLGVPIIISSFLLEPVGACWVKVATFYLYNCLS